MASAWQRAMRGKLPKERFKILKVERATMLGGSAGFLVEIDLGGSTVTAKVWSDGAVTGLRKFSAEEIAKIRAAVEKAR